MASLDLNGDNDGDAYDSDEGATLWEEEDVTESEGSYAQAALGALDSLERTRKGVAGRGFDNMRRLLAGSELEEPDFPHTIIAFRDSGFDGLQAHEKKSLDLDTAVGMATSKMIMQQHLLDGFVSDDFLDGKTGEHDMKLSTLDPDSDMVVQILPPRLSKDQLPAGGHFEEPIVRLLNARGVLMKQVTARRTYQHVPGQGSQQIIVVNEPLNKWAKPRVRIAPKSRDDAPKSEGKQTKTEALNAWAKPRGSRA